MPTTFSIIIPVQKINDYIRESLPHILNLNNQNFEVLIFADEDSGERWEKTRIIPSGHIGPAEKRDLAIQHAQGEYFAFLDDDSFPEPDWLDHAVKTFKKEDVVAVGGPAITPKHDSFWQKVSGAVFLSVFSGGNPERYWPIGSEREVDDWPTVNLIVRRDAFIKAGGFDSKYWPGEDTKLCHDLIANTGGKILYNPAMVVHHHRRPGLGRHLKQIGNYGLHRGFFAKTIPRTSRKFQYFLPSLFLLFALFGWIFLYVHPFFQPLYFLGWALYLIAILKASFDILKIEKSIPITMSALYYILATHIWYGARFLQGFLFTRRLKSKLR